MGPLPYPHISIVVFGASGDLAKKKTFPALHSLFAHGFLEKGRTSIIGAARSDMSKEKLWDRIKSGVKDKSNLQPFLDTCTYVKLSSYEDAESFKKLHSHITSLQSSSSSQPSSSSAAASKPLRLYYIALPPSAFESVCTNIRQHAWPENETCRVIVEKPYGKDTESAKELSKLLEKFFKEEEIYRIDHYLGKDTVKLLLPIRFTSNLPLTQTWDRTSISHVTINFKEEFGAEGRGGYFDEFGMIRDVMENHLFQWMVLAGMEGVGGCTVQEIHKAKLDFIKAVRPVDPSHVFTAQYTGSSKDPSKKGYKDDETVKKDSKACTFATAALYVDNERWKGVPFVMRAGKALDEDRVELTLHYRHPTPAPPLPTATKTPTFTVRDHPTKSLVLRLTTKKPGLGFTLLPASLTLPISSLPAEGGYVPEPYETLLLDALKGDKTWFVAREEAESAWRVWDKACKAADEGIGGGPVPYEYGSAGPEGEDAFLRKIVGWGLEEFDVEGKVEEVVVKELAGGNAEV
ncbi:Glucose-6-phosphate 1-dehydrogenase [Borealophlyctis nickersoniae]|nr:Glucose-6-phosphate 1-dehydrogenase [Borealophlyctis nickersoniae]